MREALVPVSSLVRRRTTSAWLGRLPFNSPQWPEGPCGPESSATSPLHPAPRTCSVWGWAPRLCCLCVPVSLSLKTVSHCFLFLKLFGATSFLLCQLLSFQFSGSWLCSFQEVLWKTDLPLHLSRALGLPPPASLTVKWVNSCPGGWEPRSLGCAGQDRGQGSLWAWTDVMLRAEPSGKNQGLAGVTGPSPARSGRVGLSPGEGRRGVGLGAEECTDPQA